MSDTFIIFISIYLIFVFSLITPGPDFFIVVRNSLQKGIYAGIYCAVGVSIGIIFHISYAVFGVAAILKAYPIAYSVILIFAAGYLSYTIFQIIKNAYSHYKYPQEINLNNLELVTNKDSKLQSFRQGFLINFTNVKAGIYFLAVFAPLVADANSIAIKWAVFFSFWLSTLVWFVIVSVIFAKEKIRKFYLKYCLMIDLITALILSLLLIYILTLINNIV